MKGYFEGYAFTVITDHQSLKWLQHLEAPSGRLARWLFKLQQYDFDVKYRRDTLNQVADALSRQPETCAVTPLRCRWYRYLYDEVNHDGSRQPTGLPHRERLPPATRPAQLKFQGGLGRPSMKRVRPEGMEERARDATTTP
ncbi:reverse ribonuclease integrase [Lasius niger]|uniref:Reverse ribonuclease integrase n=1 Tax=Lasius niger TaxID=67767 RepID=A0A0J7KE63_LASNI|nr:reverse ribonuclease integrase [Lasius niger]